MKAIVHFAITVCVFLLMSHSLHGFYVQNWGVAAIAALLLGLANATLGFLLKVMTFPLILLTFGLFSFVVNAIVLLAVAAVVPGFSINGFWPALLGALILALVNFVWGALTRKRETN